MFARSGARASAPPRCGIVNCMDNSNSDATYVETKHTKNYVFVYFKKYFCLSSVSKLWVALPSPQNPLVFDLKTAGPLSHRYTVHDGIRYMEIGFTSGKHALYLRCKKMAKKNINQEFMNVPMTWNIILDATAIGGQVR